MNWDSGYFASSLGTLKSTFFFSLFPFNNFRDNAPSYSRLGYFKSKNFLAGVAFADGSSRCKGSQREGFMTVEATDESSVLVCF